MSNKAQSQKEQSDVFFAVPRFRLRIVVRSHGQEANSNNERCPPIEQDLVVVAPCVAERARNITILGMIRLAAKKRVQNLVPAWLLRPTVARFKRHENGVDLRKPLWIVYL
jgi:hypothetical protein